MSQILAHRFSQVDVVFGFVQYIGTIVHLALRYMAGDSMVWDSSSTEGGVMEDAEGVFLPNAVFDTDPSHILMDAADKSRLRFLLIEWVAHSPNKKVKSQRKEAAAQKLGVTPRQVERLLKQYHADQLTEEGGAQRSDKGKPRIDEYWQNYIRDTYKKFQKKNVDVRGSHIISEVQRHAVIDLGKDPEDVPHPATIYRLLAPLFEGDQRKKSVRNPGLGSQSGVKTREGKWFDAIYSNQIFQSDHTEVDLFIVDNDGEPFCRPWLTTVIDDYSGCVLGYHLWFKQPGSAEVALTLRLAILPKHYPAEYELPGDLWPYGSPTGSFFTDRGKDLQSNHIKAIGKRLGFTCDRRFNPQQGGKVERKFGIINTKVLETLPGYTGSNVKERPKNAEGKACYTIDALNVVIAHFFYAHNHSPYPKDPSETRYERWLRGMGGKLPEPLDERELDVCLMKEERRRVEERGVINFAGYQYQSDALRALKGQEVSVRYDPDHALTLYVYALQADNQSSKFIGYAHALDLDTQDLSLAELKKLRRAKQGKRRDAGYEALAALHKIQQITEQQQKDKKERKRVEQQKLRRQDKQNSDVAKMRRARKSKALAQAEPMPQLPTRINTEEARSKRTVSSLAKIAVPPEPQVVEKDPVIQEEDCYEIIISPNNKSRFR